ncbi:TPA: IS6 family transposase [Burkholderia cenocepacia]|uniref:IS6 family transposase n=1 Tax=Burkholderia cenocepacia TaxID=95486 RepID=UPI00196A7C45|nr:IS6 family transposase [Burkholderia cenocepacia]MBN3534272.1 IS6 family transposase [Burkholderia cenocepacia]MBR8428960.1 IS6 family transposase [Burkholderia cenocepacia]MBU9659973.1 IS6 family transposase [Burkholderia cenocepacia]MCW3543445.1 IS6 family transposase [Burkholderia cenocepacia]MCW3663982.1 IS6 family transposase [Burkholderia cenocepacia]
MKKASIAVPPPVEVPVSFKGYRFPLSLRMVDELLAARSIELTYEMVRCWATTFGLTITKRIRSTAPGRGDKWHIDEVVVTINGRKHWMWRAVDQHGAVLDVLVQRRRDAAAAKRLMRKLLRRHGCPRVSVIVTDKLRSYAAAKNELGLNVEHRQHKGLNIRAENSHQTTRVRETVMRRFKSARQRQRFASAHGQVSNLFVGCRYNRSAQCKREARAQAFAAWERASCARMPA